MKWIANLLLLTLLVALPLAVTAADGPVEPAMPSYDGDGRLLFPAEFRRWFLAGSSLGLSYSEGETPGEKMFHHTLIEPSAYEHFAQTGEFREGTMLALVLQSLGDGVLPGRRGSFANDLTAVELAVKDSVRVADGWAYYNFGGPDGLLDSARAFPSRTCHACHAEHALHDNVFLQFYPLLASVSPKPLPEPRLDPAHSAQLSSAGGAAVMESRTVARSQGAAEDGGDGEAVKDEDAASSGAVLALRGLDPVMLVEGREEAGKEEIIEIHQGHRYRFLTEPNRATFAADPDRYSIQNDSCLVVSGAPNDPDLFAVFEGRIYAFATPACVSAFEGDPQSYVR